MRQSRNCMRRLEFYMRIMKLMKIIEFNARNTRLMKILELYVRIMKITKIIEFPKDNQENHETQNLREYY